MLMAALVGDVLQLFGTPSSTLYANDVILAIAAHTQLFLGTKLVTNRLFVGTAIDAAALPGAAGRR